MTSVFAGGYSQHARYDADSRLLELRSYHDDGTLSEVETHTWEDGLKTQSLTQSPDGRFRREEWIHDVRKRLARYIVTWRAAQGAPESFEKTYVYDARGRLSEIHYTEEGEAVRSLYTYNAAGQLMSIQSDPSGTCHGGDIRCATLSYWPNGRLKRHDWSQSLHNYEEEYDSSGRLTRHFFAWDDGTETTTRTYDVKGRPSQVRMQRYPPGVLIEEVTTTVYDAAGQRERAASDITSYNNCPLQYDCEPDGHRHQRITRRSTSICDTQIVALDEWDINEDGVVDARLTHERDPTGRLVLETYSGPPDSWEKVDLYDGPVRREFQYDCP